MNSPTEFVLEVRALSKTYTQGHWWQKKFHCHAVDNVSLALRSHETLALVGGSGCGKTTLAMCLTGMENADSGEVLINGTKLQSNRKANRTIVRREVQLIFQDSAGALNPRFSAREIIEEPLLLREHRNRAERRELAEEMMEKVGLLAKWQHRLPHEFSGGQRQRLAIARALVLMPKVLILDEVFVGLDLSVQGQIANLLLDLQDLHGLSYICISHNLAIVGRFADSVAIMHCGRIVEKGSPEELERQYLVSPDLTASPLPEAALGAHSGA
jgi:ABC-type glutathione transport system ATPase component